MRNLLIKLSRMDRRYVFLGVGILTIVPFFMPMGLPVEVTRFTKLVYKQVDAALPSDDPNAKPILLSMDYDPGTLAELGPMATAVLRHIFAKRAKVVVITFMPTGAALAKETLFKVAAEFPEAKEGVDFAYLGFATPPAVVIRSIGRNIRDNYQKDHRQIALDDLPILRDVQNFDDIHLVLDLAGNAIPVTWIGQAVEPYGANFAMGVTNVMAADYTPYIPQQSKGMLAGLRGAAEYERLIVEGKHWPNYGEATMGMDSQSITHFFIIFLIVVGNVGYFLSRTKKGGE